MLSDPEFSSKLADKEDKLSDIRDVIKNKDQSALFKSVLVDVSLDLIPHTYLAPNIEAVAQVRICTSKHA